MQSPSCKTTEMSCGHQCIVASLKCDGVQDCDDGSDEKGCSIESE